MRNIVPCKERLDLFIPVERRILIDSSKKWNSRFQRIEKTRYLYPLLVNIRLIVNSLINHCVFTKGALNIDCVVKVESHRRLLNYGNNVEHELKETDRRKVVLPCNFGFAVNMHYHLISELVDLPGHRRSRPLLFQSGPVNGKAAVIAENTTRCYSEILGCSLYISEECFPFAPKVGAIVVTPSLREMMLIIELMRYYRPIRERRSM